MAASGPGGAESLRAALARTARANPQLAAERARQRADDENVPRALSGYDPSVALTGESGPGYARSRPGTGSQVASPFSLGLSLNQTIFDFGTTAASVRSAESGVFAGRATLRGVEQDVLLAAATAYLDVLRDMALVELQRGNVATLGETLRVARKRYETGDVSRTDPAQAEARYARGGADLATAEANLVSSRAAYRRVIGVAPDRQTFPDEPSDVLPPSLKAALGRALADHPAVRSATHAVDVAASDVRVAAGRLAPTITVQGSLSRTFGRQLDTVGDTTPSAQIGPQLTVPIYSGGAPSAQVRQAKEVLGQRRIELEAAREQVRSDVRAAWGALEAARAAITAREAAVAATAVALAGVSQEAQQGQRTTLDVLNAQQEVVNARASLVSTRRDRIVAAYAALAASGSLSAGRLALAGPRYRPETHYDQVRDSRSGTRTPDGR